MVPSMMSSEKSPSRCPGCLVSQMLTNGAARLSQPDPSQRDCAGRVGEQVFSQFSPFAIFQMDDVISGWNRGDGSPYPPGSGC